MARSDVIHHIQAETEEECVKKIQEIHSLNYQIVGKREIKIKKGLFNLFQIDGIELSYMLTRPGFSGFMGGLQKHQSSASNPTQPLNFEQERNKILEQNII